MAPRHRRAADLRVRETLVALVAPLIALLLYLGIAILYAVTSQGVAVPASRAAG